jgi:hypothetical protein
VVAGSGLAKVRWDVEKERMAGLKSGCFLMGRLSATVRLLYCLRDALKVSRSPRTFDLPHPCFCHEALLEAGVRELERRLR